MLLAVHFIQRLSNWICKFFLFLYLSTILAPSSNSWWIISPISWCVFEETTTSYSEEAHCYNWAWFFVIILAGGRVFGFFVWVGFLVFWEDVFPGKSVIGRCRIYFEREVWSEEYYEVLFLFLQTSGSKFR